MDDLISLYDAIPVGGLDDDDNAILKNSPCQIWKTILENTFISNLECDSSVG